jgi:hypothetical protein
MKSEVYKRQVKKRNETLVAILDAASRIQKHEDQLRRKKRNLRTRVSKCVEVGGGIFEYLL